MISPKLIWKVIKQSGSEWKNHNPLLIGAGISFYIILSLGPILSIIVFIIGSFLGKANTIQEIVSELHTIVGEKPASIIEHIVQMASSSSTGFMTVLASIPLLFFGSTMIFYQIRNALNTIWDIKPKIEKGIISKIKKYGFSFLMLTIVGFLFLAVVLKDPLVQSAREQLNKIIPIPSILITFFNYAFSLVLLTVLFAMIYKILPEAEISWSDVWIGAAVTSFLFLIVQFIIAFNFSISNLETAFGSIGIFTVLYLWIFYSSLVFLFGAEFTRAYARQFGTFKEKIS